MFFLKRLCPIFFLFYCEFTHAENNEPKTPTQHIQSSTSLWYLDTGIRYWLGQSNFKWNLYDKVGEKLLSRLTYQDVTTNSAEGFWRLTHQGGVFFKGYVGAGSLSTTKNLMY